MKCWEKKKRNVKSISAMKPLQIIIMNVVLLCLYTIQNYIRCCVCMNVLQTECFSVQRCCDEKDWNRSSGKGYFPFIPTKIPRKIHTEFTFFHTRKCSFLIPALISNNVWLNLQFFWCSVFITTFCIEEKLDLYL